MARVEGWRVTAEHKEGTLNLSKELESDEYTGCTRRRRAFQQKQSSGKGQEACKRRVCLKKGGQCGVAGQWGLWGHEKDLVEKKQLEMQKRVGPSY